MGTLFLPREKGHQKKQPQRACPLWLLYCFCVLIMIGQHLTIPALRLKHRSGSCGAASALPKCSIMSGCGTRIVLQGQKPLALCDRCPCFGSLFPPLAALTFAASSIICAFGLASAAPRLPYRHLELCGIALNDTYVPYLAPMKAGRGLPSLSHWWYSAVAANSTSPAEFSAVSTES